MSFKSDMGNSFPVLHFCIQSKTEFRREEAGDKEEETVTKLLVLGSLVDSVLN